MTPEKAEERAENRPIVDRISVKFAVDFALVLKVYDRKDAVQNVLCAGKYPIGNTFVLALAAYPTPDWATSPSVVARLLWRASVVL